MIKRVKLEKKRRLRFTNKVFRFKTDLGEKGCKSRHLEPLGIAC